MKETYFTSQNIKNVSENIIKDILGYQRNSRLSFIPDRSVLLVLDMQNFFLNKDSHAYIPSAPAIIENIKTLIHYYHKRRLPVIFTRHVNIDNDAKMMKKWWKSLIDPENEESEIISSLDTADSKIFLKKQYDAFYETELEEYLINNNCEQLVVTGVMTHLCCETTIRSAFMRGFTVFFPIDGTATYNLEFHKSSCLNLSHGFAVCTLSKNIGKKYEEN